MAASKVRGAHVWIDRAGRCYGAPSGNPERPRFLYRVDGGRLRFVGHGARRCEGCGVTVNPTPEDSSVALPWCQLCGAEL